MNSWDFVMLIKSRRKTLNKSAGKIIRIFFMNVISHPYLYRRMRFNFGNAMIVWESALCTKMHFRFYASSYKLEILDPTEIHPPPTRNILRSNAAFYSGGGGGILSGQESRSYNYLC